MLTLRDALSAATIAKLAEPAGRAAASAEDAWQRRSELLFERLAVRWEIAGLPLDDQKMLLGRYRMADDETRRWVRRTIAEHVERHIPELGWMHAVLRRPGGSRRAAAEIAEHAERELEALVAVSSPSGDVAAPRRSARWSPRCCPATAAIERPPCSTAGPRARPARDAHRHAAPAGVLLLGHLDTVVAHADHRPLERAGDRLIGSGTIDMKGGIALALGVLRALAALPEAFAELSLLAVNDEEWRVGGFAHGAALRRLRRLPLLRGRRARPGRRGGASSPGARPRRRCGSRARGVAAHSGSAPGAGRNALLALGEAARRVAALSDPAGRTGSTAVPTVLSAGRRLQRRPRRRASWSATCAPTASDAFEPVLARGARRPRRGRARGRARPPLARDGHPRAGRRAPLGPAARAARPPARRSASAAAPATPATWPQHIALTVDGLGPRGGHAHHPDEFVLRDSLRPRAEVALAVTAAALAAERDSDIARCHNRGRSLSRSADDRGYFPAGESVLRRVHAERAVGLNYGQRALMLGAAHPVNFIGTQANTRSGARPFLRLAHTAKVFETIFFGTRAEADEALAFVDRLHQRVRGELAEAAGRWPAGTSYSAFDPALMLWTVAVIADSAEVFYETFVRSSAPAEKDALWHDYVRFGELFGMPRDAAPATYSGFRAYWEEMWTGDELHLTDEARDVALAIAFEIPMPRYLHPSREVHNLVLRAPCRRGCGDVRRPLDARSRGRLPRPSSAACAPPAR